MAVKMGTFSGARVFLSRSLVPPEMFDALHDALRLNGAQVLLCCDPSQNSPDDYHVISSSDHEKFEDLRAKGCNLLGPHCVLSCAKERRVLPKQGYTCCLAMDGVKVLASGFEKDEKVKIEQLVTAMGGALVTKAALDVNFVIAKNVLAAKYRWALYILKKPVVDICWLRQCWAEHRVVPQEPYRILPFTGLTICVTKIPADEREEMRKLIIQNRGKYSADLTKTQFCKAVEHTCLLCSSARTKCHLLVGEPCVQRLVFTNSGYYLRSFITPCCCIMTTLLCFKKTIYVILDMAHAPEGDKYKVAKKWGHIHIVTRKWFDQSITRKARLDERHYPVHRGSVPYNNMRNDIKEQYSQELSSKTSELMPSSEFADIDITISQNLSSTFSDGNNIRSEDSVMPIMRSKGEQKFDCNVAEDSEDEDNDLYLSSCRILLVGFQEKELHKLVNMIRKGGGSRYMLLSEKLTHIIVGTPSEIEKKEVRRLAAWGVINVVKTAWLEDCDQEKKEVPISQRHVACDLLLPKDTTFSHKIAPPRVSEIKNGKTSTVLPSIPVSPKYLGKSDEEVSLLDKNIRPETCKVIPRDTSLSCTTTKSSNGSKLNNVNAKGDDTCRVRSSSNSSGTQRTANVFRGLSFCFSSSFPKDKRAEIEEWVMQGGGLMSVNQGNASFIIECHGVLQKPPDACPSPMVSSHWIRFCLEYEDKERVLLKNLCFTLGAKFTEKLSKRSTHLICKFTSGPKYEAACNWGIEPVTAEWINECIRQDMMVASDRFRPRVVTAQDRETGLCITSQYPTQAAYMVSGDEPSQVLNDSVKSATKQSVGTLKRQKLSENNNVDDGTKTSIVEDLKRGFNTVSDVADAIEDLLAQSNEETRTAEENGCHQNIYSPGHFIIGQEHTNPSSSFQLSDNRLNRSDKQFSTSNSSAYNRNLGTFDSFSETQTDSQVVLYEEDLSGRQKIIERVRSQSITLTPEPK